MVAGIDAQVEVDDGGGRRRIERRPSAVHDVVQLLEIAGRGHHGDVAAPVVVPAVATSGRDG